MREWNPWKLYLPVSFDVGELDRGFNNYAKALGWEIGEKIHQHFSRTKGPNWFSAYLTSLGHKDESIHDPAYIFKVLKNKNCPFWEVKELPEWNNELNSKLFQAKEARNRWEHNALEQNLDYFSTAIFKIKDLAAGLNMEVAENYELLLERFQTLKKTGGILPQSDEVQQYKALLAGKVQELEELSADQVRAEEDLRTAVGDKDELQAARQRAEEIADVARAELEKLREKLHAELQHRRLMASDPADEYIVGQTWASEWIGARTLTLITGMNDFYDPTSEKLLSLELGPVACDAAARWLVLEPRGGVVNITPSGHGAIFKGAQYRYLGRLDDVVNGFKPHGVAAQEFITERYLWSDGSVIRLDEEDHSAPDELVKILSKVSDLNDRDDVPIRITTDGIVAGQIDHQWIQLAKLPA
jgi:hypothetical protein